MTLAAQHSLIQLTMVSNGKKVEMFKLCAAFVQSTCSPGHGALRVCQMPLFLTFFYYAGSTVRSTESGRIRNDGDEYGARLNDMLLGRDGDSSLL